MKNQTTKFNKSKLVARGMLIIFLLTGAVGLTSCIFDSEIPYNDEVYTHKEFVNQIKTYNSFHDLYTDTFISFDLDDKAEVSKSIYYTLTMANSKARGFYRKHGYVCDRYCDGLLFRFVYYLKSDGNDYAYKIKCFSRKFDYNFTKNDQIEILKSNYSTCMDNRDFPNDLKYEESMNITPPENASIYNNTYHYSLYVNDAEYCCIHISSIEKASAEKLDEICQMLLNSLVVINAEDFFIWRDIK